jgi:hypothetical protein
VHQKIPFSQIGLTLRGWQRNVLIGICAGSLELVFQRFLLRDHLQGDDDKRWPAAEPAADWILSQMFSVLAEEMWLALCTVSLIQAGHWTVIAVLLSAAVFGALHYRYRTNAIVTGMYGAVSVSLFLWRGSVLPFWLFHYARNMGSFYWARRAMRTP